MLLALHGALVDVVIGCGPLLVVKSGTVRLSTLMYSSYHLDLLNRSGVCMEEDMLILRVHTNYFHSTEPTQSACHLGEVECFTEMHQRRPTLLLHTQHGCQQP